MIIGLVAVSLNFMKVYLEQEGIIDENLLGLRTFDGIGFRNL